MPPIRPQPAPPAIPRLQVVQLRVMSALAQGSGRTLTRAQMASEAGLNPSSGTITYALTGKKLSKANPRPFPGVMGLGLVDRRQIDCDGEMEWCYFITELGRRVLAEQLAERGGLPQVKPREASVNNRYKEGL